MNVLELAREFLQAEHHDLRLKASDHSIVVPAKKPNGFAVSINDDLIVSFDGWHEHFFTPEEALKCFEFGFSTKCRLKVTSRCRFAYKWTLEALNGQEWIEDSTTGLIFFPFWCKKRIVYLQNW